MRHRPPCGWEVTTFSNLRIETSRDTGNRSRCDARNRIPRGKVCRRHDEARSSGAGAGRSTHRAMGAPSRAARGSRDVAGLAQGDDPCQPATCRSRGRGRGATTPRRAFAPSLDRSAETPPSCAAWRASRACSAMIIHAAAPGRASSRASRMVSTHRSKAGGAHRVGRVAPLLGATPWRPTGRVARCARLRDRRRAIALTRIDRYAQARANAEVCREST